MAGVDGAFMGLFILIPLAGWLGWKWWTSSGDLHEPEGEEDEPWRRR